MNILSEQEKVKNYKDFFLHVGVFLYECLIEDLLAIKTTLIIIIIRKERYSSYLNFLIIFLTI
jgi:hypothetical protein